MSVSSVRANCCRSPAPTPVQPAVAHGAPLRLGVERQLGYEKAKYVMAVEVGESFGGNEGGHGGYWEDQCYEWYAAI